MPINFLKKIDDDTVLTVWHITETLEEIASIDDFSRSLYSTYSKLFSSPRRIIEKILSRRLLREAYSALFPEEISQEKLSIKYNDDGKPTLAGGLQISISHAKNYVALILSRRHTVGIDIETKREQVKTIADRFLRSDETAETLDDLLLIWCAKETMYKYFSELHLDFDEMKIPALPTSQSGTFLMENVRKKSRLTIFFNIAADHILTYTVG